jgi:hypothetical protein
MLRSMTQHDGGRAAPPDDGGTTGSFTRPEDTLTYGEAAEEDSPPLHRDPVPTQAHGPQQSTAFGWLIVFALGLTAALFYVSMH